MSPFLDTNLQPVLQHSHLERPCLPTVLSTSTAGHTHTFSRGTPHKTAFIGAAGRGEISEQTPTRVTQNTCCASALGRLQKTPESLVASQWNWMERLVGSIFCAYFYWVFLCIVEVLFDSLRHQDCKQNGLEIARLWYFTRTLCMKDYQQFGMWFQSLVSTCYILQHSVDTALSLL